MFDQLWMQMGGGGSGTTKLMFAARKGELESSSCFSHPCGFVFALRFLSFLCSSSFLYNFYHYFYMLTNVLFYVSSAINPILYNLVSANFRQIFLSTLTILCLPWRKKKKRLAFARKSNSISSNHTFSSQVTRETTY